jgi:16S rRNA (cytidine1402-2'-O)-methyltransferase
LLSHYNISTPTISYYEHNRYTRIPKLIDHLIDGEDIALITDAGTPGISDPAYRLIRAAINSDCRVESIPGASASLAALVASGLPTDRFIFEGFLPHKKGRKGKLEKVKDIDATIIFYESPNRLVRTLKDILEHIGDRPIAIGRELSKKFEEIMRGRVSDILSHYNTNKPKGEFVIVIGKDDPNVYF